MMENLSGVMVDFRKAFDLVDHNLLLQKLRLYEIVMKMVYHGLIHIYQTGSNGIN